MNYDSHHPRYHSPSQPRGGACCATPTKRIDSTIFNAGAWSALRKALSLTSRELEIIRAVFNDSTELSIAKELGLSPHTIHTHLRRLYEKLSVTDRVQLVLAITREFLALTTCTPTILPPLCSRYAIGVCPSARSQSLI